MRYHDPEREKREATRMIPQTPTITPEGQQVQNFMDAATDTLSYLYSRWQDEKEYEDINDYAKPLLEKATAAGLPTPVMQRRPFGCKFTLAGKTYLVYVNARTMGWKRVK